MRAVTLGGMPVALGSAAGRPQLLWFFATWCSVCRASEHNVRAMIEREGVVLVACDSGSDAELLAWLRAHSLDSRRVVNDHDGAIARAFGVRSFPTTVAVSASGLVRSLDVLPCTAVHGMNAVGHRSVMKHNATFERLKNNSNSSCCFELFHLI
jgi:peroxiredoxin